MQIVSPASTIIDTEKATFISNKFLDPPLLQTSRDPCLIPYLDTYRTPYSSYVVISMLAIRAISSYYFKSVFLLFNNHFRIKFTCIFISVRLSSFTILKAFLTHFWQLVFAVTSSDFSLWLAKEKLSLLRKLLHRRIFKCTYTIFYLYSFAFTTFLAGYLIFSKFLVLFFSN